MIGHTEEDVTVGEDVGRVQYMTGGGGIGRVSRGPVGKEGWPEELSQWNTKLSPAICR